MSREDPQLKVRLTAELKDRLADVAQANGRSMNAEIVQRLEESFSDTLGLPPLLLSRIAVAASRRGVPVRNQILEALEQAYPRLITFGEFIDAYIAPIIQEDDFAARAELIEKANIAARKNLQTWEVEERKEGDGPAELRIAAAIPGDGFTIRAVLATIAFETQTHAGMSE